MKSNINNELPAIGILIRALSIGGAEKQSLLLARTLMAHYRVYYFVQKPVPRERKHLQFIQQEGIDLIELKGRFVSRLIQLNLQIRSNRIGIVFSYLTLDNMLAAAAGMLNKKLVVVGGIRNCLLPPLKFGVNKILHRYFIHYSVFNNYSGRDGFLKKGFKPGKSIVIPNCIDHCRTMTKPPPENTVRIISVSRFTKSKNYRLALEVIQKLKARCSGFTYMIVGYGNLEFQIREWIRELEVDDTVQLIVDPEEVNTYFEQAHIYFSTSSYEGLPNSIMEAMNHSLAVIATDVGDTGYLVKDGATGFLINLGDSDEMAAKLHSLISDRSLMIRLGKNGFQYLHENFSEGIFQQKYLDLIQKCLQRNYAKAK